MRFREEVLNVALAEILRTYGLAANPEIMSQGKLPDVRIVVGGLKVILEGKAESLHKELDAQVRERLTTGLADISIGLYYRAGLNEADDLDSLKKNLAESKYAGVVYYWATTGIKIQRVAKSSVQDLVEVINRVFTLYTKNDLLARKITEIEVGITKITGEGQQTSLFLYSGAVEGKLRKALGIPEEHGEKGSE